MKLRRAGCAVLVGVHPADEGPEPALRNLDVGVDQDEILHFFPSFHRADGFESSVVATCEAIVLIQQDCSYLWKTAGQQFPGPVVRGTVRYDYFCPLGHRVQKGREELPEEVPGVPVEDDYSCLHDR